MSKAVIARKSGDEYQDDWFWLQASRIFHKNTTLKSVGYEVEGLNGFDDVVVDYEKPNLDEYGDQIKTDYFQAKYHVDYNGAFTAESLIDPKFINSKTTSLLQRVKSMQRSFAPDGRGARFIIVSPWTIHPDDPLSKIVATDQGQIRIDQLFTGTSKSNFGKLRKMWSKHLALGNEDDLRPILRPFKIQSELISKTNFSSRLDDAFIAAGLQPVNNGLGNKYHDLIKRLHKEGHNVFSRSELIDICTKAGLYSPKHEETSDITSIGIRSFSRWTEHLEDETTHLLDLVPYFDNRTIRNQSFWKDEILPRIQRFLAERIEPGKYYHIHLDTHSSISFSAGSFLGMKTGASVIPIQNVQNKRVPWEVTENVQSVKFKDWTFDEVAIGEGSEFALALSVTHDIVADVKSFVSQNVQSIGKVVHGQVGVPSNSSVIDANHAYLLAQSAIAKARTLRSSQPEKRLHIFFASPNAMVFFLGRLSNPLGNISLYEYDFDKSLLGAYKESIILPF